ncbi:MAG: carboxypeptidase regulatory-like domain-containing protein [Cytophagaceae bacterium]|nr:carboxypeptidase regulatory-like domain-containing protein [Gemmatimonadaceae bacterium]
MQTDAGGDLTFNAPDADVLTSTAFVRDHCFSVSRPSRERPGLVGLAFQPVGSRRLSGIQGALWLDSTNYALRLVEFGYTKLPSHIQPEHARGEVQFGHLQNGAWYVSKWFIRMPEYKAGQPNRGLIISASPTLTIFREEGGDVTIDGIGSEVRTARLTGIATDSTGRPLRDAVVRLAGTERSARTGSDGHFRIDSLPAGAYTLWLEHRDYASLGLRAAEQELEVVEGRTALTAVKALNSEQVRRRLCSVGAFAGDVAAVQVSVKRADSSPVRDVEVRARWNVFERPTGGTGPAAIRPITEKMLTDSIGTVMFCAIPARQQVRFEFTPSGQNQVIYQVYTAPHHSISSLILRP